MPSEPSPTPSHVTLRNGMHALRNVLNAVQINAYAARQMIEDGPRTIACLARIEDAVQRGAGVLQSFPAEETLATAEAILRERLRDAGGEADVHCAEGADPKAHVPGLVRQALCLVAVESQGRGARSFALSMHAAEGDDPCLQCEVDGLPAPGPVAMALGSSGIPGLALWMAPRVDGWTFRWSTRDLAQHPAVPA